jgi:hypothetical protein
MAFSLQYWWRKIQERLGIEAESRNSAAFTLPEMPAYDAGSREMSAAGRELSGFGTYHAGATLDIFRKETGRLDLESISQFAKKCALTQLEESKLSMLLAHYNQGFSRHHEPIEPPQYHRGKEEGIGFLADMPDGEARFDHFPNYSWGQPEVFRSFIGGEDRRFSANIGVTSESVELNMLFDPEGAERADFQLIVPAEAVDGRGGEVFERVFLSAAGVTEENMGGETDRDFFPKAYVLSDEDKRVHFKRRGLPGKVDEIKYIKVGEIMLQGRKREIYSRTDHNLPGERKDHQAKRKMFGFKRAVNSGA